MNDTTNKDRTLSSERKDDWKLWRAGERRRRGVVLSALAQYVGISGASARDVMQRLQAAAEVAGEMCGMIVLTPTGGDRGAYVAARHSVVERFFTALLGVPEEIAGQEACRGAHGSHPDSCGRLKGFVARFAPGKPGTSETVCLALMRRGWSGWVVELGGSVAGMRLARLGLYRGAEVQVLQNRGHGPVIVLVGNSRVAVGRCLAARVLVCVSNASQGMV